MSMRRPSVTLVLALAAGACATATTAWAQDGNLYQIQGGERFDDWTLQGFRNLDADGNGRITAAEWKHDRADFRRADHNVIRRSVACARGAASDDIRGPAACARRAAAAGAGHRADLAIDGGVGAPR